MGALLPVVIPPLFGIALFKNNQRLRIAALVLGLIFSGILILITSGGGWIALICGLAFVLISWRLWMLRVVVPALGLITSAVVVFYDKTPWLMQAFSLDSFMYRVKEIWAKTIPLFKNYDIVTGLGLGSWNELYSARYGVNGYHLHNSYFQMYTDTGILGALALSWAVVVSLRLSISIISSSRQNSWYGVGVGLIGSIIAGGVFACYDVTITGTILTATSYIYLSIPLLWVLAALLVVSNKHLSLSHHKNQGE